MKRESTQRLVSAVKESIDTYKFVNVDGVFKDNEELFKHYTKLLYDNGAHIEVGVPIDIIGDTVVHLLSVVDIDPCIFDFDGATDAFVDGIMLSTGKALLEKATELMGASKYDVHSSDCDKLYIKQLDPIGFRALPIDGDDDKVSLNIVNTFDITVDD